MTTIAETVIDYFPANNDVAVPLKSVITILFSHEMDETQLAEDFFIEGPDTDQFVGPGGSFLANPDNVSQGDDFLSSPGYKGIVQGTFVFKKISMNDSETEVTSSPYRTKLIFTPSKPMAALTTYVAHIPEVKDSAGITYEGYYTFTWTTGSGSIQELPASGSTSVLGKTGSPANILSITRITPDNHSVQIDPNSLEQIIIEFDKELDPNSVSADMFKIMALPATDHPSANVVASGELEFDITVSGNRIILTI